MPEPRSLPAGLVGAEPSCPFSPRPDPHQPHSEVRFEPLWRARPLRSERPMAPDCWPVSPGGTASGRGPRAWLTAQQAMRFAAA
jgi:hypothetical protein